MEVLFPLLMIVGVIVAIVVIVFCSTVILPVPVSAAYPKRSKPVLQRSRLWIERHDRTLLIFVLVLFGLVFCIRGVWPLL